jgi:hypothetical protein
MLSPEDLERMVVEIMTGQPPSLRGAEADAMRERLRKECAEIVSRGGIVDVPDEIPDL